MEIGVAGLVVAWEAAGSRFGSRSEALNLATLWVALAAMAVKLELTPYAARVARHPQHVGVHGTD